MGLLDKVIGTSKRPSVTTPEMVAEGIAYVVGKSFSAAQFTAFFRNAELSEGWTMGDALAAWYSLGNLALVVAVWTTYDKAKAPAIIELCHPMVLKHWNMPEDVFEKFITVVGETEVSAFVAFTCCKDGVSLGTFFGRYVSRMLGAPVPFSQRNTFEDDIVGITHRTDLVITVVVCRFLIETCITTKKFLEKYPLGVGLKQ